MTPVLADLEKNSKNAAVDDKEGTKSRSVKVF